MKDKSFKKSYKSAANVQTRNQKVATTAVKIARPLLKFAKFGSKYATSGKSFSVPGIIADATIGYAKRKGEKYLDKKLGKYQAYRVAKNSLDLAYDIGTGNPMAAIKHATNLYAEADPNKKRVAKVAGTIRGTTGLLSSAATGNVKGAFDNGLSLYSLADKNKKRVDRVSMNIIFSHRMGF